VFHPKDATPFEIDDRSGEAESTTIVHGGAFQTPQWHTGLSTGRGLRLATVWKLGRLKRLVRKSCLLNRHGPGTTAPSPLWTFKLKPAFCWTMFSAARWTSVRSIMSVHRSGRRSSVTASRLLMARTDDAWSQDIIPAIADIHWSGCARGGTWAAKRTKGARAPILLPFADSPGVSPARCLSDYDARPPRHRADSLAPGGVHP